ncbi:hypothetical protein MPTK1_6g20750 [Marchantia polymorpha subsp. ruderalis]|uniref:Uncharacterized protein n=2 Tax=Marchantia polymorpha TaxID=3197 RepID=A0A176VV15_MARPO|nr:hypothetical protein AXG93_2752s2280 [Marchantia polymorpha subsp. ruderalis]PTQ33237.1 hypothetical protein MARPO_0091s0081 [Marchantia polymorpha]BBN15582.1 hypothetical protein Mp_6g20750 [Marchantia polymorpha subsp. ruderalis]|eukprot:PTQ33237.1 hypothetical protein MARPO_0091s0081 [Marchantia polymorpha]
MASLSAVICNVPSVTAASLRGTGKIGNQLNVHGLGPQLSVRRQFRSVGRLSVRASRQQEQQNVPLPGTKVEITEEQVKKNEQEEPLRVFDNTAAGKFARPESERRPELGNTDFVSVMKFDGPAPETINGRLAMLGITWAFAAEVMTGQSIVQQVVNSTGLLWFLAVAPIFIGASFVPIFGWNESPDSRAFGPFNAKAERWNGRAAMIGFFSMIVTEQLLFHGPVFGFLHH